MAPAPVVALAGVAATVFLQTGRDLAIVAAGLLYDAAYLRPRRDTHWILWTHSSLSGTPTTAKPKPLRTGQRGVR